MYADAAMTPNTQPGTTKCDAYVAGAWWYNSCHRVNLNGRWVNAAYAPHAIGINWYTWKASHEYALRTVYIGIGR